MKCVLRSACKFYKTVICKVQSLWSQFRYLMSDSFYSAREIIAQLSSKEMSASDLMKCTIAKIWDVNDQLNAIVSFKEEEVLLSEAQAADKVPMDRRGPLHGLPIAIKDLADAEGLPTSYGSPIFAGQVAKADALPVARIRAAGAIIIGKTNTPEFGLGSHTFNPVFGTTYNPYNLSRSAGGSSGGAAVALATGMIPIADGSDMMGSLRNPAAWSNIYGMRPSWGLVPAEPKEDVFLHSLSTSGPMARNPNDLALLLSVMSGADPRLPFSMPNERWLPVEPANLSGKRIGWLNDWGGAFPIEPSLLRLSSSAVQKFSDMGASVDVLPAPYSSAALWESWKTLRSWSVAASYISLFEAPHFRDLLKPALLWEIERGRGLSGLDIHKASAFRSDWYATAANLFEEFDVLVLPSTQIWPFPADQVYPTQINDVELDTYHRWMEVVIPASLIGLPVVNVPAGFGHSGLPFGLQLIGGKGQDAALLSIAQAWHEAKDWPKTRPPQF